MKISPGKKIVLCMGIISSIINLIFWIINMQVYGKPPYHSCVSLIPFTISCLMIALYTFIED